MGLFGKILHRTDKTDTWYKCTECGREGRVGRCCGNETRIPLNSLAKEEQKRLNVKQTGVKTMSYSNLPDGCSQSDIDAYFDGECPDCGSILREHYDGYSYCPRCGYIDNDESEEEDE